MKREREPNCGQKKNVGGQQQGWGPLRATWKKPAAVFFCSAHSPRHDRKLRLYSHTSDLRLLRNPRRPPHPNLINNKKERYQRTPSLILLRAPYALPNSCLAFLWVFWALGRLRENYLKKEERRYARGQLKKSTTKPSSSALSGSRRRGAR